VHSGGSVMLCLMLKPVNRKQGTEDFVMVPHPGLHTHKSPPANGPQVHMGMNCVQTPCMDAFAQYNQVTGCNRQLAVMLLRAFAVHVP
jgi:hypothetical protein